MSPLIPTNPRFWIGAPPEPGEPELLKGLLHRHSALLITGETNVGKTLVALELAHALLTGEPLWGKLEPTKRLSQITYIMGEHDKESIQALWGLLGFTSPNGFWVLPPPGKKIVARGELVQDTLRTYRTWCEGADLAIFDPLAAFASGVDVENDNAQMRSVVEGMETLIAPGALTILAHMGKMAFDPKAGKYIRRESYATRGASSVEDAVLDCFYMEKDTEHEGYKLRRRKYKGQAPSFYRLARHPTTLRHTLLAQGPTEAQLRATRQAARQKAVICGQNADRD